MIPDWQTNTVVISDRLPGTFPELIRGLDAILAEAGISLHILPGTRDYWIRDYAPIQVIPDRSVQFRYEPDYLLDGYRSLITPPEVCAACSLFAEIQNSSIVLDGGNVVGTERLAIVTDKIRRENRQRHWGRLQSTLAALLQVEQIIKIPVEPGDEIGHADGMVRFLDESTVVVNDYWRWDGGCASAVEDQLANAGLKIHRLPYAPETHRRKRGEISSAVGNYVNFLRVGSDVVVPAYGLTEDQEALHLLQQLLPDCQIHSLPCRELAKEGGVLNCVTTTIACTETSS
jgi:agmatine deiminase